MHITVPTIISTGLSRHFLMYGQAPRFAVDVVFGLDSAVGVNSTEDYMDQIKAWLKTAYESAQEANT